ncbi:MAG: hypothetical protein AAF212_02705, partial [Verrucomicrobiota bacterium]
MAVRVLGGLEPPVQLGVAPVGRAHLRRAVALFGRGTTEDDDTAAKTAATKKKKNGSLVSPPAPAGDQQPPMRKIREEELGD